MNTMIMLIKREYWENKSSFLKVPIVVGGISVFVAVCTYVFMLLGWHAPASSLGKLNANKEIVRLVFYTIGVPFVVVMWLIIANYFLGCLYDDRKDKSILFWQSMPITETQVVISKIIAGLVLAPLCTLLVLLVTQIIMLVLDTAVLGLYHAQYSVMGLWSATSIILAVCSEVFSLIQQILWLLPFVAWFMAVSAFAKKSPFLRALVPIIILLVLDGFFWHEHYFSKFIGSHLLNAILVWSPGFEVKSGQLHGYFASLFTHMQKANDVSLIVGIILAVIGFVAAIVIRNRSENL